MNSGLLVTCTMVLTPYPVSTQSELVSTGYLLVGLVVIITFKDTVLQAPQVCAVLKLFSSPRYSDGLHLNELSQKEDHCEEEQSYSQSICTISSTPLELTSPYPDLQRTWTLTHENSWALIWTGGSVGHYEKLSSSSFHLVINSTYVSDRCSRKSCNTHIHPLLSLVPALFIKMSVLILKYRSCTYRLLSLLIHIFLGK